MDIDWQKTLSEIEDLLIPHFGFDIYKRAMYLFLLTQTRARNLEPTDLFAVDFDDFVLGEN